MNKFYIFFVTAILHFSACLLSSDEYKHALQTQQPITQTKTYAPTNPMLRSQLAAQAAAAQQASVINHERMALSGMTYTPPISSASSASSSSSSFSSAAPISIASNSSISQGATSALTINKEIDPKRAIEYVNAGEEYHFRLFSAMVKAGTIGQGDRDYIVKSTNQTATSQRFYNLLTNNNQASTMLPSSANNKPTNPMLRSELDAQSAPVLSSRTPTCIRNMSQFILDLPKKMKKNPDYLTQKNHINLKKLTQRNPD